MLDQDSSVSVVSLLAYSGLWPCIDVGAKQSTCFDSAEMSKVKKSVSFASEEPSASARQRAGYLREYRDDGKDFKDSSINATYHMQTEPIRGESSSMTSWSGFYRTHSRA